MSQTIIVNVAESEQYDQITKNKIMGKTTKVIIMLLHMLYYGAIKMKMVNYLQHYVILFGMF